MRHSVLNHKAQPNKRPERTPVDRLFAVFGTARTSAIAKLTTEAVRKWNRRRSTGGGGGLVPAAYQSRFLEAARHEGLALCAEDFIAEPWE